MDNRILFLLSKGVSHTGTKLFTFSLSWYILSETGSGLNFSLSLLVNYLPAIIMSAFAGYISDRTGSWFCAIWRAPPSVSSPLCIWDWPLFTQLFFCCP